MNAKEKQQARYLKKLAALPFQPMEYIPGAAEAIRTTSIPGLSRTTSGSVLDIHSGYRNNLYAVWVSTVPTHWGHVDHLWVRRHDGQAIRPPWHEMQRIKREVLLTGAARSAVEVHPRDADVVDSANMYHLWVLPLGFELPFSLKDARP